MNPKDLTAIMKKLNVKDFFQKKGRLAYYFVQHDELKVLVGIFLDTSIDAESFLVEYFVQPLFIPFPTFSFTIGKRVGTHWNLNTVEKLEAELQKLSKVESMDQVVKMIKRDHIPTDNNYVGQALAFGYFSIGDIDNCVSTLDSFLKKKEQDMPAWKQQEFQRMEEFRQLIESKNIPGAKKMLLDWQTATSKDLRFRERL